MFYLFRYTVLYILFRISISGSLSCLCVKWIRNFADHLPVYTEVICAFAFLFLDQVLRNFCCKWIPFGLAYLPTFTIPIQHKQPRIVLYTFNRNNRNFVTFVFVASTTKTRFYFLYSHINNVLDHLLLYLNIVLSLY